MARVLVVGAGAVGCYFGVQLQRAGHAVTFLARAAQAAALQANGLRFESRGKSETVAVQVATGADVAAPADFVLLCVKSHDTAAAAREVAPHLRAETRVLCLQNGVTNHAIFAAEAHRAATPAVVFVAAQMESPTHFLHNAAGHLVIGNPRGQHEPLEEISALFASAHVPCRVSDAIERELWEKLIINCAFNGISALTRSNYGALMAAPRIRDLMEQIIREAVAVTGALGIPLEFEAVRAASWQVGETMHAAISSTAQDLQRGKPTEIDFLNGHVVAMAQRAQLATPANQAIHALVKLLETTR